MSPGTSPRWQLPVALVHFWLPVAVGWSLALLAARSSGLPLSAPGLLLLLAGIGAAYQIDRLLDPAPRSCVPPTLLAAGAAICVAMGAVAAWHAPGRLLAVALCCGGIALAYPRLKRLPLAKTIAVALVWTWAAMALPLAGGERLAWAFWSLDIAPALFLLMAAACLLCDLKDATADRARSVPSLPARLGARATCHIATGLALCGVALAAAHGRWGLAATGGALCGVACFPRFLARPYAGPIVVDGLFLIPGVLIAAGWV